MISLRKYIDAYDKEFAESLRTAGRAMLIAVAKSGGQAVPALATSFHKSLSALRERLGTATTPDEVVTIQADVESALVTWGDHAAKSSLENLNQIREVMMTVATSAASISDRDHRYTDRFKELATRLHSVARVADIETMRRSVVDSAAEMKTCVAEMSEESERSLEQLRAQVSRYRLELKEFQRRDSTDSLTGLANRQEIDAQIQDRIAWSSRFCLAMLDLNEFKLINDTWGHAVGDDVLKQFAAEIRFHLRSTDVVGRWGGDEFVLIVDSPQTETTVLLNRLREWAFGEYQVENCGETISAMVTAAIGIAEWDGQENAGELFNRVDQLMYRDKRATPISGRPKGIRGRAAKASPPPSVNHTARA